MSDADSVRVCDLLRTSDDRGTRHGLSGRNHALKDDQLSRVCTNEAAISHGPQLTSLISRSSTNSLVRHHLHTRRERLSLHSILFVTLRAPRSASASARDRRLNAVATNGEEKNIREGSFPALKRVCLILPTRWSAFEQTPQF